MGHKKPPFSSFRKSAIKAGTDFFNDESGGLPALEFVLVSIPAILLSMSIVQYMLFANSVIVMRSAAYAAARSALVNHCPPIELTGALANIATAAMNSCTPNNAEILNAARIALIPIASSSPKSKARQGSCSFPDALPAIIVGAMRNSSNMKQAFEHKACYAFEPGNVTVDIKWDDLWGGLTIGKKMPPVTAKVTFKLPLLAPVRAIFFNGRFSDGVHYYQTSVEVTLL
jgi:Flp pilus assembly protein TadG